MVPGIDLRLLRWQLERTQGVSRELMYSLRRDFIVPMFVLSLAGFAVFTLAVDVASGLGRSGVGFALSSGVFAVIVLLMVIGTYLSSTDEPGVVPMIAGLLLLSGAWGGLLGWVFPSGMLRACAMALPVALIVGLRCALTYSGTCFPIAVLGAPLAGELYSYLGAGSYSTRGPDAVVIEAIVAGMLALWFVLVCFWSAELDSTARNAAAAAVAPYRDPVISVLLLFFRPFTTIRILRALRQERQDDSGPLFQ